VTEVRLEGLGKRFGRTWAVRGVDLVVRAGEFLTLVGPSGCGKSTLLNLIAGLETPSQGRVLFDGRDVGSLSPSRRDVAVVFQTYALYPHLSVRDNVSFPLRMARRPRSEIAERVRETAALLRIEELLDRKPAQLSGGQRQRVAVARALVRRPAVFLLDEPLSNLDAKLRLETRVELKRLHAQLGTTFLYVTHDQTEAMTLSGRLAVLNAGRIHQVGEPEMVYADPDDEFVARFLGSPPMNLLPVVAEGDGGLRLGALRLAAPPGVDAAALAPRRALHLGIRPEDLCVLPAAAEAPPAARTLAARVELVEPLGAETLVHLRWENERLTARLAPAAARRLGERVLAVLEPEASILFDAATGLRVRSGGGSGGVTARRSFP
jgi:multiple sugar transport system ATP-binding protein